MYINMYYHCVRKSICMELLSTKSLRTRSLIFYKYIDLISRGKSPVTDPEMIICNNLFNIKYI